MIRKSIVLFIFLAGFLYPQSSFDSLRAKLNQVTQSMYFDTTLISLDVYDLTKNQPVFAKNQNFLLEAASNMKILTTSVALYFLGPDYKFRTSLYYTGNIHDGILNGNLYVVGGGDPHFTDSDLDSLILKFKQLKINKISGNIYGDVTWKDSLFWGSGWMWDDDPSTDAPYLSALTIDNNAVGVFVEPGEVGQKAIVTLKPNTDYVKLLNETVTLPEDSINNYIVTRDWMHRKNTVIVSGDIQQKAVLDSSSAWHYVNVFDPADYFLTLFKEKLAEDSIAFNGTASVDSMPSYTTNLTTFSRPFDSVVVNLLKNSDNLSAEMTLYALSHLSVSNPGTAKSGIKMIDSLVSIIGLNPKDYNFADGSGVSRYNLVSANLLLSVLKYFYYDKPVLYQILYNSFPIAGVDGTLKDRMKNTVAENNVHAKTGTLSGVSSLSGYVTAKNGDELAFSILIQNFVSKAKQARDYQDKICQILASFN
jgi:D-alanyl-D-alanine carboxypeptidase/D-alanyl-D-alanine-endopeptidase (penicillin-binding protein 4)